LIDEQERLRRIDMLQFQLKEIRRVNPSPESKELLEAEERILNNHEKIAALVAEAYGSLYESESAVLAQSNRVHRILQELERFDSAWTSHRESVRDALFRLEDVAYALRDYSGKLDYSPGRLDEVQQKLSDIERLLRKYGATVQEVLSHAERCESELAGLETMTDTRRGLEEEFKAGLAQYRDIAGKLASRRRREAARFEREIRAELSILAMEKTDLRVVFHPPPGEAAPGASGLPPGTGPTGTDHLEFLVSANRGEEPRPLTRVASGGELSRIMLAIKTICGAGRVRTMVFDEVDAGIGGRVAEIVGKRLRGIAGGGQVLCVTHLPQIAAFADEHYRVWKDTVEGRTETFAERLDEGGRLEEIARMLGGENVAETALGHARGLVNAASRSGSGGKKQV
jgi:DNA repair protein RecN (Recombination protein N)